MVGKRELWEQPFQACTIDADGAVKRLFPLLFLVFRPLAKGKEDWEQDYSWPLAHSAYDEKLPHLALGYILRTRSSILDPLSSLILDP